MSYKPGAGPQVAGREGENATVAQGTVGGAGTTKSTQASAQRGKCKMKLLEAAACLALKSSVLQVLGTPQLRPVHFQAPQPSTGYLTGSKT